MKLAIVTRADENILRYSYLTLPLIKKYSEQCNAEFINLTHKPPVLTKNGYSHYRGLKVAELLNKYDRVLLLDADIIINKNCPNLFEIVPEDKIGSIFEDKGSRKLDRRERIKAVQKEWGDVGWKKGYTNGGVFLVSKIHKVLAKSVKGKYWLGEGNGDVHAGYKIHQLGFEVFELPFQFNHMTMFSEPWNKNTDRFDSYIIHYAGKGIFEKKFKKKNKFKGKIKQIKSDWKKIYGNS